MKKLVLALLSALALNVTAQPVEKTFLVDPLSTPRQHNVDMLHMRLQIAFDAPAGKVIGTVTHIFSPLQKQVDTLFLDGPGITINSVSVNNKDAKFKTNKEGVIIYCPTTLKWGEKDSVKITYEATPRKGIYFIGWNDPNNLARKQIWTQGQAEDNRYWIPCFDGQNDKLTTEVIVDFENGYKVLSNGTKLAGGVKQKDGKMRWHYRMKNPHSTYLVMIGIGKYDIKESKSKSGVPMYMYYYPEMKDRVEATYKYSEEMMDFFENEIGVPYGWESYSQIPVADFMYGAMENTTATVYGDFYLIDERSYLDRPYVGTNAHELAHQWFGDLVTARSLTHHWLQESFATYYNGMFEEKVFGKDYYSWARRGAVNAAIEASKTDKFPIAYSNAGTTRHYPKGAHVLHMLKYVVGYEEYNKGIKYYLTQHKYKNVDSEDLLIAFHDALGVSLDWFWEEWVYKGGEPAYNVSYKTVTDNGALSTMVSVDQTHNRSNVVGLFKMPFVFEVYYTDGTKDSVRTTIEKEHHDVLIPNKGAKKIAYVLFDPNSNVMKQVTFTKTVDEYRAQAAGAPNMIDRYDALVGLRSAPLDEKRDFLIERFDKETFHAPKAEIISQLANDNNPASVNLIKKALADKDDDVRKAAINNLTTISTDMLPEVEKLLKDPSYDLVAMVLEKLAFNNPAGIDKYLDLTKGTTGVRGHNVEIKWLEVAIGAGKKEFTDKLVEYTSNSYEFLTRVNAINALKKLNIFSANALPYTLDAAVSPNTRLSGPAIGVLKYFYEQAGHRKAMLDYYRSKKWKNFERDLLKPIFGE